MTYNNFKLNETIEIVYKKTNDMDILGIEMFDRSGLFLNGAQYDGRCTQSHLKQAL